MGASNRLSSLKNADLAKLLNSIGSKSSGKKSDMIAKLQHDSNIPKLSFVSRGSAKSAATTRVLSIDMGIKNLAFCVCDVPVLETSSSQKGKAKKLSDPGSDTLIDLSVLAWKRIAVTGPSSPPAKKKKATIKKAADVGAEEPLLIEAEDPFSPPSLSKTAYTLVKQVLLPYAPDTILIERQRFRSGGGSAVQEWTLRVNMFESMIWAILTTFKIEQNAIKKTISSSETIGSSQFWDVSPMRVASFWLGDAAKEAREASNVAGVKVLGRAKVEKKMKVELVQRWITPQTSGGIAQEVNVAFTEDAIRTRDAFLAARNGRKHKVPALRKIGPLKPTTKKEARTVSIPVVELPDSSGSSTSETLHEGSLLDIGKLDDLADCLLQAAAWTKWERNRQVLRKMIDEEEMEDIVEWAQSWE